MKRIVVIGTVLLSLILAGVAFAQAPAAPMPEILQRVLTLEGKWVWKMSLQAGGKTTQYKMFLHGRKTADGKHLLLSGKADIPGQGQRLAEVLTGYDFGEKKLRWVGGDNFGFWGNGVGELLDPNHLRVVIEGQPDGKALREVIDFFWKNSKTIEVKQVITLDGEVQARIEGTWVRKRMPF